MNLCEYIYIYIYIYIYKIGRNRSAFGETERDRERERERERERQHKDKFGFPLPITFTLSKSLHYKTSPSIKGFQRFSIKERVVLYNISSFYLKEKNMVYTHTHTLVRTYVYLCV